MGVEINDEVRLSLSEAGIGKRYHDMTLADLGKTGDGMMEVLRRYGPTIRAGQTSLVFEGPGTTEPITMLARGLHINRVGCRVVPLVRMRRIINDPDFREAVNEIDCLVLLNAQDRHRGNPLHDAVAAEVEYTLRTRYDNRKATILQVAFMGEQSTNDESYWSDEFWDMVSRFERITPEQLIEWGGKSK